ncbi:YafY family protein [Planomicrobium sp. CPCC 101079]|uniref:helix-turn-helix transcriptional regulator n=1 Tax=Planomicrobium sp. CPCC 101079 TaxID=2599618 RepID=UPI0011B819C7|nr:WYL domain-containing protein [Planomicrobium sp. CPCC 101079]TWT13143.1 WYL domain-containing protein [Planomicrobium sp. CPCC 101079]
MIRDRLLAVVNCLATYSSEEEPLSLQEIKKILESEYDLELTDKMIRKELKFLESAESSYDFFTRRSATNHRENVFYLKNTAFEVHELRYLMDAISAAKFISPKDTLELIYKIRRFTDEKTSKRLSNQLVKSEAKIEIKHFADNIQAIHEAIRLNKCIKFQYGRYNVDKDFLLSRDGGFYEVIPFGVIWSQEFYYLIAQEHGQENIKQYRIDRMSNVLESDKSWIEYPGFNLEEYVSKLFNMYSGEVSGLAIEFDNHLISVVIDRFGLDAKTRNLGNGRFLLEVEGVVSMGLVRWLLTWGADAKAVRPAKLVEMMKKEIDRYAGLYT